MVSIMKHLRMFFILFTTILTLFGCNRRERYAFSEGVENICSVQIVDVAVDECISLRNIGNINTTHDIDKDALSSFIDDLKNIPCYKYWNDPLNYIAGTSIMIVYNSGIMELISPVSTAIFTPEGSHGGKWRYTRYYFDQDQFYNMVSRYNY